MKSVFCSVYLLSAKLDFALLARTKCCKTNQYVVALGNKWTVPSKFDYFRQSNVKCDINLKCTPCLFSPKTYPQCNVKCHIIFILFFYKPECDIVNPSTWLIVRVKYSGNIRIWNWYNLLLIVRRDGIVAQKAGCQLLWAQNLSLVYSYFFNIALHGGLLN